MRYCSMIYAEDMPLSLKELGYLLFLTCMVVVVIYAGLIVLSGSVYLVLFLIGESSQWMVK